ncbi:MAG: histidine kinase [Desulfovibrionaceae bacterium]|nr:histidine kinase [Desulfovibrionaceae bacterium]
MSTDLTTADGGDTDANAPFRAMVMYRTVADFTYDWEVWLGPDGRPRYVSPSCARITGRSPEEALADPDFFATVVHPQDYPAWRAGMDQAREEGAPSMDFRIVRPDGSVVWAAQETTRVSGPEGEPMGLRLSLRDVTDRVAAQTALREANERLEERVAARTAELVQANADLRREIKRGETARKSLEQSRQRIRNLSAHLRDSVEKERRRISREIHDELGQTLTALGMGLARLEKRLPPDDATARERVADIAALADSALSTVRRIARELRPAILDDLGLGEAISAHARTFAASSGIAVTVDAAKAMPGIDPERATALFRVLQEALTNVARHAGATHVRVKLSATKREMRLVVADDGRGAPQKALDDPTAYGILGMRERMRFFGGDVDARQAKTGGITVTAVLPLAHGRKAS